MKKNSDAFWNLYNNKGILVGATGNINNRAAIIKQLENARKDWEVETFEEWKEKNEVFSETIYVKRGDFIYQKLKDYVSKYFNENKVSNDTFKDDSYNYNGFWSVIQEMQKFSSIELSRSNVEKWAVELIWRVTYFHYQVGNAIPYLYDCDLIRWNGSLDPEDGSLWSLVVGFATSARQYQLVTFPYLDDRDIGPLFRNLITELEKYEDEFDDEKIEGYPRWVWELEPSVAR